jgi:TolB-like protein/class 3 adenylate cyclase/Flp pilus assembly protein TadD
MEGPHRKLAAILIADAVGYSRLMGADEEGALTALKASRATIEPLIAERDGRIFGGAGDSIVAEFPSAVGALTSAMAIQEALAAPGGTAMQFRIGINVGDVMIEGDNLYGDGVNVTERLQGLAEPGGICISASVHEQVRDRFPNRFVDLGEQQVKNIARAVRAYKVGPAGAPVAAKIPRRPWLYGAAAALLAILALAAYYGLPRTTAPMIAETPQSQQSADISGPPIIAVLPFANLSGDPDQNYFSDGLTEDIILALGRFSNISVISKNAVFRNQGQPVDMNEIKETLKPRYILEGSVRKSGDQVRIGAQLTDTMHNLLIWSEQYDRQLSDIFAVQDEITRSIVGTLAIKISRIEEERVSSKPTDNLDAYDYLLRGRAFLARRERADNITARSLFEQALKLDPDYAEAHVALGFTYHNEVTSGWVEFLADSNRKAEQAALTAMRLDPELSEPHQLLGLVYLARNEYDRAQVQLQRAIELNPSDAYSYATAGAILVWVGEAEEAIRMIETARRFDPLLQWRFLYQLGFAHFLIGQYEEAVRLLEPISPPGSDYMGFVGLAASYAMLGRDEEARQAAAEVKRRWPFFEVESFVDQWAEPEARAKMAEGLRRAGLE